MRRETTLVMTVVMALVLYPPTQSDEVDYRTLFEKNRGWFLATFATTCVLDITVTALRERALPDPTYLVY